MPPKPVKPKKRKPTDKITDKQRLDWLTKTSHTLEWVHRDHNYNVKLWACVTPRHKEGLPETSGKTPRQAIDAAMQKEGRKP